MNGEEESLFWQVRKGKHLWCHTVQIMRIDNDLSIFSIVSVIVGTISMLMWLIPIIGVFSALFTIYSGAKGYDSNQEGLSKLGIYLGIVSLVLTMLRSGLINGFI